MEEVAESSYYVSPCMGTYSAALSQSNYGHSYSCPICLCVVVHQHNGINYRLMIVVYGFSQPRANTC